MNLQPFLDAFTQRKWVLLGALILGAVIALIKQGQAGVWLQSKLPKGAIPFFAPVLGAVGAACAEVIQGHPWQASLFDGVQAGVIAVFGHQLVIEGMRGGREFIAKKDGTPTMKPAGFITAGAMRLLMCILVGGVLFGAIAHEAACTPAAQATVNDVGKDALCVYNTISTDVMQDSGASFFEDLLAAVEGVCGPTTMAMLEQIVQDLIGKVGTSSPLGRRLMTVTHKPGGAS